MIPGLRAHGIEGGILNPKVRLVVWKMRVFRPFRLSVDSSLPQVLQGPPNIKHSKGLGFGD